MEDNSSNKIESIYVDNISKFEAPLGEIMEHLLDMYPKLPQNLHMKLYTNLRLSHSFGRATDRLKEHLKIYKYSKRKSTLKKSNICQGPFKAGSFGFYKSIHSIKNKSNNIKGEKARL